MLVCVYDLIGHVRLVLFPLDVAKRHCLGSVVAELNCRRGVILGGDSAWLSGHKASLCTVCARTYDVGSVVATIAGNNLVQVCKSCVYARSWHTKANASLSIFGRQR